jgi:hypothetical protein
MARPPRPALPAPNPAPLRAPNRPIAAPSASSADGDSWKVLFQLIALAAVVLVLSALALPSFILLAVGLLPTIVIATLDRHPLRLLTWTVAPLDIAATMIYAASLWRGANDVRAALSLVETPQVWLVIYGASGFGWLLHSATPAAARLWSETSLRRRRERFESLKQTLRDEWGEEVVVQPKTGGRALVPRTDSGVE